MGEPRLVTAIGEGLPALVRVEEPTREPFCGGLGQEAWHADAGAHAAAIERGIAMAAGRGRSSSACRSSRSRPRRAAAPG